MELSGCFWPASHQIVKRGWLSSGAATFGPDLKAEEKLDQSQAGGRTAKAWPVDTRHMNPLAVAEPTTGESHSALHEEMLAAFIL